MHKPKEYSITVEIEQTTLNILRADPRNVLVFVRDIGLGSDVVEQGNMAFATYDSKSLSATQTLIWTELHSVTERIIEFEHGSKFKSGPRAKGIERGQEATVNADSSITVTGQNDPTGNITVTNCWKNGASVVLGCKGTQDDDDDDIGNPYYFSPSSVIGDIRVLTPVQSFTVVFTHNLKTLDMIDVTKGIAGRFEIAKGKNDCVVKFDPTVPSGDHWMAVKNATKL